MYFPLKTFFTGILGFYLSRIRSSPFGIMLAFGMNEHLRLEFQSINLFEIDVELKALKSWFNKRYSVSLYLKSWVHSKKVPPILNYHFIDVCTKYFINRVCILCRDGLLWSVDQDDYVNDAFDQHWYILIYIWHEPKVCKGGKHLAVKSPSFSIQIIYKCDVKNVTIEFQVL